MAFTIQPATAARFDDVQTILGPKRAGAQGCWCLSIRLGNEAQSGIHGAEARADYMRTLCRRRTHAPGVLAYDGDDVVGWAGTSPLSELVEFTRGKRYPVLDEPDDLWAVWCLRVKAGNGKRGIASALVAGAAEYAAAKGASGIVGYPVDNDGAKVDRTLASVGTRIMFERAGFRYVAAVDGKRDGMRQVVMRRDF